MPRSGLFGWRALWAVACVWWSSSGLLSGLNYHQMAAADGAPVTWRHALLTMMVGSYLSIPLTLLAFWLARHFPLERSRWRRSLGVLTLGAVAVVTAKAILIRLLNPWVGWYERLPSFGSVLITSINNNLFVYWMFIGVAHALHFAERERARELEASRLEALLSQARLEALRAQLQPHFLFNTLQSIAELVHRDPDGADRMLVQLGDLLRHTLGAGGAPWARLRDELAFLQPYLEIEQVRFGDRLRVSWDVEETALEVAIPSLLMQPLVENALRHGLAPRAAPGHLSIAAHVTSDWLALEIRDDGIGCSDLAASQYGVGLANTRARLQQCYGDHHRFGLFPTPGGGTTARIEIPHRGIA